MNASSLKLSWASSFTTVDRDISPTIWDHNRETVVRGDDVPEHEGEQDEWIDKPLIFVRVHRTPRRAWFDPSLGDDPPPIPWNHIGVVRTTMANLENIDAMELNAVWDGRSFP